MPRRLLCCLAVVLIGPHALAQVQSPPQGGRQRVAPATPGQSVPGQAAPGQVAPRQPAPGQAAPGQVAPGQVAPGQAQPAQGAPAVAPDPRLPTVEQLRQQLATDPQEVMRSVSKLLSLKGPSAQAYDRYELYMLRGEAALRNKQMPMAAQSFEAAQKETQDIDKQFRARAHEVLLRRSKQNGYVPRTSAPPMPPAAVPAAGTVAPGASPGVGPGATPGAAPGATPGAAPGATPGAAPGANPGAAPGAVPGAAPGAVPGGPPRAAPGAGQAPPAGAVPGATNGVTGGAPAAGAPTAPPGPGTPIPILDEGSRKQAFAALFNDELTTAQPKLKAAAAANSLKPIIEVARTLGELRAIEMEAYGSAEQTKQHGAGLGERAHKMVEHAMNGMDKEVEEIWDDASRSRVNTNLRTGYRERQYGLHGLDSTQVNALKGIISTTEKLVPVARDLGAVTGDAQLQSDAQAAQKLYDRATEVLKYDYANEGRDTRRSQPQPRQPQPLPPRGTGDVVRP